MSTERSCTVGAFHTVCSRRPHQPAVFLHAHVSCANRGRKVRKRPQSLTPFTHTTVLILLENYGESVGVRTRDLLIKSQLLYQLSYALPLRGCDHPGWKWAEHRQATNAGQPKILPFANVRHISCGRQDNVLRAETDFLRAQKGDWQSLGCKARNITQIAAGENACRLPIFPCGAR